MPLVSDPGFALVAGLRRRGAGGRGAARARRGARPRWWRARCRPTSGASRASSRASAARWRPRSPRPRRSSRSSPRAASAPPWRCSPSSTPSARSRSAASSPSSTRRSCAARAAELAAKYASEEPRGRDRRGRRRRARAAPGLDPAAVEAVRTLVEAGAGAKTAAKVVAELTGAPANALYRESPPDRSRSSPPPCGSPRGSGRARCRGRARASARAATRRGRR